MQSNRQSIILSVIIIENLNFVSFRYGERFHFSKLDAVTSFHVFFEDFDSNIVIVIPFVDVKARGVHFITNAKVLDVVLSASFSKHILGAAHVVVHLTRECWLKSF